MEKKEYVVRVEGIADSFGIGEVVAPGCTLFRRGYYNLSRVAAEKAAKLVGAEFPYSTQEAK